MLKHIIKFFGLKLESLIPRGSKQYDAHLAFAIIRLFTLLGQ